MEKVAMNQDEISVVYSSDDNFASFLGISILSLLDHSKDLKSLHVYILDNGISEGNKSKISTIFSNYENADYSFMKAIDIENKIQLSVHSDRGSSSQYARLFISSILPKELKRVIYLDSDIIINDSIQELWNLDLHGKTIGALMDAFSRQYRKNIDLKPNDIMFNSGVMIVDLMKWKQHKIEEKLLEYISLKSGKIQQSDQGALNHVLTDDVYCFDPKFNTVTIFYDFSYEEMLKYRNPPAYYSKELVANAVQHPVIIHFTTSIFSKRPWIVGCEHIYLDKWLMYKNMSPWKDMELRKDNRPVWKKFGVYSMNFVSRKLVLRVASVLQIHIRPIYNKIMLK